jgi:hypothetical protein
MLLLRLLRVLAMLLLLPASLRLLLVLAIPKDSRFAWQSWRIQELLDRGVIAALFIRPFCRLADRHVFVFHLRASVLINQSLAIFSGLVLVDYCNKAALIQRLIILHSDTS